MQPTKRPNRDALMRAIDIYRDAMRPFIVRQLRRVQGASVEELIERGLGYRQADEFYRKLDENDDIESAIDLSYFPKVIRDNWRGAFAQQFSGDPSVQNMLWLIKTARDQIAHPGTQDIEGEYTRVHLYHIADLLRRINAPEEKQAVETIRDNLFASAETRAQAVPMQLDSPSQTPSTETQDREDNPQSLAVSTFQTESGEVLVNTEAKFGEEDAVASKVARQATLQTSRWSGDKPVREVVWDAVQELTGGDINVEFAPKEVSTLISNKYPDFKLSNVGPELTAGCPNLPSYRHHSGNHKFYWRVRPGIYRLYNPEVDKVGT